MPICDQGHKLRSQIFGYLAELSLPLALLRGLSFGAMAIGLGILQDLRLSHRYHHPVPHLGLMSMAGVALVMGVIAFSYAWIWAGMDGPAHRLAARAFGTAVGYLAPGIVACHALYFSWANSVESACLNGMVRLVELAIRHHWLS